MLRTLRRILLRGLAAVLPIGLTLWLIWWLATSTESLLKRLIVLLLPDGAYRPGMGIAAGFILLLVAGLLLNAYVVRRVLRAWEQWLERIPVVKTIYGAVRDFAQFLPSDGRKRELQRVVMATFGHAKAVGFVTRDSSPECGDLVPVYFPMSYQIGGYTLYLARDQLEPLDMSVEDAMRMVLTGGMSQGRPAQG